jgi:hypothetical protein
MTTSILTNAAATVSVRLFDVTISHHHSISNGGAIIAKMTGRSGRWKLQ